ncbi:MAG: DNA-directed RNA polymerase subunit omega [Candidatus Omnitrophica bacterium]|nr:DNA-directed RNA polymerase subunit omega [Candidatus Omnitrophota bacterium]
MEEKDMSYVPMEDLLKFVPSSYKLVILASQRAIELNEGKERLVNITPKAKNSTVALAEIREGKIAYKVVKNVGKK